MYLGTSESHSNTVGRIMNTQTGYISPQYHCVYDNQFSSVPSASEGGFFDDEREFNIDKWNSLLESGYKRSFEPEYDSN